MRRKGEFDIRCLDRLYPYQVIIAPEYGPDLHMLRGYASLAPRNASIYRGGREYHVLCFSDEADARLMLERSHGEWLEGGHRKLKPT